MRKTEEGGRGRGFWRNMELEGVVYREVEIPRKN
jgi:hypothetical protein